MKRFWPFRHFGLKLLSLAIALLLWMSVSGEETVERGLRVPIELQQLPAGVELTGEVPTTVDVRVRGGSSTLSRVGPGDVVGVLDLRTAAPGRRVFPLTQDQFRVPFGVEIVQISPSAIAIMFEPSATRKVPVAPTVEGRPAPGFVIGTATVEPATVDVVGPESAVKRVTEAVTEAISVEGATDRVRQVVTLGLLDPLLRLNVRSAAVTVPILPAPLERTFRNRPVHLRNVPPDVTARAEPTAVDVTMRGSREALSQVGADAISAYVDLAGLGVGQYELPVHVEARDAGVMHIEPAAVQIWITSVR